MISIIDFTRRNDPACKEAVELLEKKMKNVPDVFTFWSKNPNGIYNLYHKHIDLLQKHNCLVLGMFTITGYDNKIEPGIDKKLFHKLDNIINLLGDPDKIKLRFDPIIPGYTTLKHLEYFISIVEKYNIKNIVFNFLSKKYPKVHKRLSSIDVYMDNNENRKIKWFQKMKSIFKQSDGYILQTCAEANYLDEKPAACINKEWILKFKPNLDHIQINKNNRIFCNCCNTDDFGVYKNWKNGYKCPHGCLYCYAC